MKFEWFPEELDSQATATVKKFLSKGLKKHSDLRAKVKAFMQKVEETEDLQKFFDAETIAPLHGNKKGLYEMRIPPERRGGVVRIYFCFSVDSRDTLVLLDAELKKKTDGDYDKAVQNMKVYWKQKGA